MAENTVPNIGASVPNPAVPPTGNPNTSSIDPNWSPTTDQNSIVSGNPGLSNDVNVAGTVTPLTTEPNDPYASVSPVASSSQNNPEPVVSQGTVEPEGSVPAVTGGGGGSDDKVVATSHDGGSRRKVLLLLGALVLVVVVLIVGSFLYSNLNPSSTTTKPTAAPTKAATSPAASTSATKAPSPAAANLPDDVPAYGNGTLTVATRPKGQIGTDQKTADSVDKVMEYYQKELAANGWVLGSVVTEGSGKKLTGEKGNRQIVVQATPTGGQTTIGIIITNATSLTDTGKPKTSPSPTPPSSTSVSPTISR